MRRGGKEREVSEAHNAPAPKSVSNAFAVSPEEVWSKKFMTAAIGPNDFKPVQMPVVAIARTRPELMCAPAATGDAMMYCALPAIPSSSAGSPPCEVTWLTVRSSSRVAFSHARSAGAPPLAAPSVLAREWA